MVNDCLKITEELKHSSYRDLQLITKHYKLPSNYKKMYLIQMIVAKRMGLEQLLQSIIEKAKTERYNSKRGIETNSLQTQVTFSPPICTTPHQHLSRYYTRRSLLTEIINNDPLKSSDAKTLKQYENLSVRNFQRGTKLVVGELIHKVKLTSQHIMKHQAKAVKDRIKFVYSTSSTQTISTVPARRQRILSGIYPIKPNTLMKLQKGGLTVRKRDGTVSRVNAIIQDRPPKTKEIIRDVLQDLETYPDNLEYRNMSTDLAFSGVNPSQTHNDMDIVPYDNRINQSYKENHLPNIRNAFSKFNNRDFSEPLFVDVSASEECSSYIPQTMTLPIQLETLYNFKSSFTYQSLLQKGKISDTISTKSTVTVMSTKVLPTSTAISHNAYTRYNGNVDMLICKEPNQCNSDYSNNNTAEYSGTSSIERSSIVDPNITIPEMVEDALEVISQDEDYMSCVQADAKIGCVLCDWCGPIIVVEYHIQKIHANEILKQQTNNWNITFTLESLVQETHWCNRVLEYESILYVLSAKYSEPDVIMATLTSLSTNTFKTGSITVFNTITGEPFVWEGEIKSLSTDWSNTENFNGLEINRSQLNAGPQTLPIAGQPGLDNVHIILFARLYN